MGFTKIMADKMLNTEQILSLTPADAQAALARRDAATREAALREAEAFIRPKMARSGNGHGIATAHQCADMVLSLIGGAK